MNLGYLDDVILDKTYKMSLGICRIHTTIQGRLMT